MGKKTAEFWKLEKSEEGAGLAASNFPLNRADPHDEEMTL